MRRPPQPPLPIHVCVANPVVLMPSRARSKGKAGRSRRQQWHRSHCAQFRIQNTTPRRPPVSGLAPPSPPPCGSSGACSIFSFA
eukprot:7538971-Pyramimonas_sp.AAC.1